METQNAHVVIPVQLLKEIDKIAGKRMRGRFLVEAAKERLKRLRLERALERAAGAWKNEDHADIAKMGAAKWVTDKRREDEERFQRVAK